MRGTRYHDLTGHDPTLPIARAIAGAARAMGLMTVDDFRATLGSSGPPDGCSAALAALWHDAKGNWEEAHRIAQAVDDEDGAWVHAYLHRKEGDSGNARHWYRRACRKFSDDSLAEEWERIVLTLLSGDPGVPSLDSL